MVYRYKAFISYRHVDRDRKWAKWLLNNLETYRVPKHLIKQGIPSRVGILFRDDDEIPASSNLSEQIESSLKDSEFLIVICSPDTPLSKWVQKEIEIFQGLGRSDNIIALLVGGEPDESFPQVLSKRTTKSKNEDGIWQETTENVEPLAADTRLRSDEKHEETKRRALLRITACLLKCRFDDLAQRDLERQKKQKHLLMLASSVAVVALTAFGYFQWDYNRVKINYYVDYGERWMVPYGINELSEEQAKHRILSYKIQSQHRQVINMQRVSYAYIPRGMTGDGVDGAPAMTNVSSWKINYDAKGATNQRELLNGNGKLMFRENIEFSDDKQTAIRTFTRGKKGDDSSLFNLGSQTSAFVRNAFNTGSKSNITHSKMFFTEEGLLQALHFQNGDGAALTDSEGSFGVTYTYNGLGQLSKQSNLNHNYQKLVNSQGVVSVSKKYQKSGELTNFEWLNLENNLGLGPNNYAKSEFKYDDQGNLKTISYFGLNGNPVLHKYGYARITFIYDEKMNQIGWKFYGLDDELIFNTFGHAQIINDYDSRGNLVKAAYFGVDGKPVYVDGYHAVKLDYDSRGNQIRMSYFDVNGKPNLNKYGFAITTFGYDSRGNVIKASNLGITGKPIFSTLGYATKNSEYDSRGNEIKQSYSDADGSSLNINGCASTTFDYDQRGNLIKESCINQDGRLTLNSSGDAFTTYGYDQLGHVVRLAYFGIDGKSILGKKGYSEMSDIFDQSGNVVERSFFGVDAQLLQVGNVARMRLAYDMRGNRIRQTNFGADGNPVLSSDGWALATYDFDLRGNIIKESYFDTDGKPVISNSLCAQKVSSYDQRGNKITASCFGINKTPVLNWQGYAKIVNIIDERGNKVDQSFFGIEGEPILNTDGLARIKNTYDERGNKVEQSTFGLNGQPILTGACARLSIKYDQRGTIVGQICFDENGKVVDSY